VSIITHNKRTAQDKTVTTSKKNTLPTTNALLAIAGWDHAIDWEALGWAAIVRDGAITVWSPLEEANNSPGAFYTQYDLTPEQSGSLAVAPDPVPAGYLRGLIVAAGISQQEAARRLHVDPATLRRWPRKNQKQRKNHGHPQSPKTD
jgi:hypothetical protein